MISDVCTWYYEQGYRRRYCDKTTGFTSKEPWFDSVQEQDIFLLSASWAAVGLPERLI
jgi:hypothetical protein